MQVAEINTPHKGRTVRHRCTGLLYLLLVLGVLLVVAGCIPPFGATGRQNSGDNGNSAARRDGPAALQSSAETLTLGWDHPSNVRNQRASRLVEYRLYYRERGSTNWTQIQEIQVRAGDSPIFTVHADQVLGSRRSGSYEFGVSSLPAAAAESAIHSSADENAKPPGGWYLQWRRP